MIKHTCIFILSFVVFFAGNLAAQSNISAKEIMAKSLETGKFKELDLVSVFKTIDKQGRVKTGKVRILSKSSAKEKLDKRRISIIEPEEMKGTHILVYDYTDKNDEMWVYMPAIKEPRKIVSNKMTRSFMGSEFTLGDMSVPGVKDFNFNLLGSEEVDGADCWVIECIPVDKKVQNRINYSKEILYIDKSHYITRKGEFFDKKGKLVKKLKVTDIKKIDPSNHAWMALHMSIENVQTGRKSEINMEDIKVHPKLSDNLFTVESLNRDQ